MVKHGDSKITKKIMDELFVAFNDILKRDNWFPSPLELLICGGAVMVIHGARDMTNDIDSVRQFNSRLVPKIMELQKKYEQLQDDWLNDDSYDPMIELIDKGLTYELYMELSNLTIYILTDESMLVTKINASREKDFKDIEFFVKRLNLKDKSDIHNLCDKYSIMLVYSPDVPEKLKKQIDRRNEYIERLFSVS